MSRNSKHLSVAALVAIVATLPAYAQDMSRYVAVGDSLSAGVISASIGEKGQDNSFPALFARQAVNAPFEQPLVSEPGIPARLALRSLDPLVIAPEPGLGAPRNTTAPTYQNLGVPGADAEEIVNTVTDGGGPFDLVLRGMGTALMQAVAQAPTFSTVWVGANDVLAAATSGMVIEGVTITPADDFERDFRTIVSSLDGVGASLVLMTVPNVTVIPFVSTIPPVLIDPETNEPIFVGGLPVTFIGPEGPLSPSAKVLLTASGLIAQGVGIPVAFGGTGQPLPDDVFLSRVELAIIENRVLAFNEIIKTVASETGSVLLDTNAIFNRVHERGFQIGGVEYDTSLLGGLFSFDGVHPSPTGYAIVANELISAVNTRFGGGIPPVSYLPFISGDEGNIGSTTLGGGPARLTRKARKNLRKILGVPGRKKLRRIKRRAENDATSNAPIRRSGSPETLTVETQRVETRRVER